MQRRSVLFAIPVLALALVSPGVAQPAGGEAVSTVPPQAWIDARVGEAQARLALTEAGQLTWAAIEAHGGLASWFSKGAIHFRFNYAPVGERPPTDTTQVIDLWSSRARHHVTENPAIELGWSGSQAWSLVPDGEELGTNPRFWSLTPYYFVAIPFVMADPGTVLTSDGPAELDGRTYDRVRVTYEAGTGDAPEDYYVVWIDQATHRVGALSYIVSYPGFFPDGGHSPEKLMRYDGEQVVDGIVFAASYRTFRLDEDGAPAELVTNTTLSDVRFVSELPADYFEPPPGAALQDGL